MFLLMNGDLFPVPLVLCCIWTVINCRLLTKGDDHKWKFEIIFFLWRIVFTRHVLFVCAGFCHRGIRSFILDRIFLIFTAIDLL